VLPKSRKRISESFEKEWIISHELRTPILNRRIKLIDACSDLLLLSIPKISHSWLNNKLIQKMPLLSKHNTSHVSVEEMNTLLTQLALDIDLIHTRGLIHGDIHPKNVLFTGTELKLIDFEPILEYNSKGIQYYCSTRPWIAHEDLKNKKLSVLTDRIGFTHTAMHLLNIKIPTFNTSTTYLNRRQFDYPIGGLISDELVKKMNCNKVLAYIYTTYQIKPELTSK